MRLGEEWDAFTVTPAAFAACRPRAEASIAMHPCGARRARSSARSERSMPVTR